MNRTRPHHYGGPRPTQGHIPPTDPFACLKRLRATDGHEGDGMIKRRYKDESESQDGSLTNLLDVAVTHDVWVLALTEGFVRQVYQSASK